MKKIYIFSALILAMFITAKAQQDPQFSQNMFNRLYTNPGVAGSNGAICGNLLGRYQWMGFDGKPETALLTVHAPVSALHGGVGLAVSSDELGQEGTMNLKLMYAYRTTLGVGDIGIGAGVGILSKSIGSDWKAIQDYTLDNSIPDGGASNTKVDFDLGVYYKTDRIYFGVSSTHLTESELKEVSSGADEYGYKIARHYFVTAGYDYEINPTFTLQPSVFVKSDASSAQIDLNCLVLYNQMFWGGVSYRFNDAISPMIGLNYPVSSGTVKFGYSYDITTSQLKKYSNGSHELMLGYCHNINKPSKVQKHKTVRFL